MSGGLTEAKSLRRLTQAFRMAALCCSLGSVTASQPSDGKHSIPRGCVPKRPLPEFSNARERSDKESRFRPRLLGDGLAAQTLRADSAGLDAHSEAVGFRH